jgi:myo-inositol-1(or 4)-monophosphatase
MRSPDAFIQNIARKGGVSAMKLFGKSGVKYTKSDFLWDVVTKADLVVEKIITEAIHRRYPEHGILAEEIIRTNEDAEYVWIIDPIDGTANFASKVPMFGIMIALAHKKKIILSVIYLPATKELYFAKQGKGAFLNGKRIHCSRTSEFSRSYGMCSSSIPTRTGLFFQNLLRVDKKNKLMLGAFGSVAANASYVAAGRRDWIVQLVGALWDFAPVSLMLKEAGCKVTDTNGKPWKFGMLEMVAANPTLHKELLKLTKGI